MLERQTLHENSSEKDIACILKKDLVPHFNKGIHRFIDIPEIPDLLREVYLASVATRYNAIYFISRQEAQNTVDFVESHKASINDLGVLIDNVDNGATIINTAVRSYLKSYSRLVPVTHAAQNSFQTTENGSIRVCMADLVEKPLEDKQQYDLHDFAHMVASRASSGAYSARYHDGLFDLPQHYKDITYSPGMKDGSGVLYSDGILLTQLSLPQFDYYYSQGYSDKQVTYMIAIDLFDYLKGEKELYHPLLQEEIKLEEVPDALDLAVLAQNKRYERRGAEVEKQLFVRGTPEGVRGDPGKDPLYHMSRSERILFIATNPQGLYFEDRNLLRNRAQELSYRLYAHELLKSRQPLGHEALIHDIIRFIDLEDLKQGIEINLYKRVGGLLLKN